VISIRRYLNLEAAFRSKFLVYFASLLTAGEIAKCLGLYGYGIIDYFLNLMTGSAGFEPAISSARGWHHTMLDNDPSDYGSICDVLEGIYLLVGTKHVRFLKIQVLYSMKRRVDSENMRTIANVQC
jgi:hypothetical protein